VSDGILARLRTPLTERADLGEVLGAGWGSMSPAELARRPVRLGARPATFGDLFELGGQASGSIRFEGDLRQVDRLAAGMAEGAVVIEGPVGEEVALGMAGGSVVVRGNAGPRAGGAPPEARRGMSGGELIIHGNAGPEAGARMRRGLIAIGGRAVANAGAMMIAGTVVVLGAAGPGAGLWSKRGSVVALSNVFVPQTYRYDCTYQPAWVRLTLSRLRVAYELPVKPRHLTGFYRRYSGDLADLGRGEILEWTAQ
jgi:formylmethanofuran dehydrogenase subunit C